MRASTQEGMSPRGLYHNIFEQDLTDEIRNTAIETYLEAESLPAHLAHQVNDTGNNYVHDFMWLYHGHPDMGGHSRKFLPLIERDGRTYTKTLVASVTDGGTFVHVREQEGPSLELDDPQRYFVATLDLLSPQTTEWPIGRVDRSMREVSYGGTRYMKKELFLSDGLRSIPAGIEENSSKLDEIRAQKIGKQLTEQAFKRMPRIVLGYQTAEFVHDGLTEQTRHSVAEVVRGAERIAELRRKFGHLPVWYSQQSFSQEVAV